MYQDQMTANAINPVFSPFNTNVTITNPVSTDNPYQGYVDPFPLPTGPAPKGTAFQIPMAANPMTLGMKAPTIEQWNLTLEQQVFHNQLLRLAYEGMNSYHLFGSVEGNAAVYNPAETVAQNLANYNVRRPMGASYQGLALGKDVGIANYESLTASLQKQAAHGLTFLMGYRWSKCMDESEEGFFGSDAYSSPNPHHDYAPCSFNVTGQFKGSFVWDLPHANTGSTVVNHILNHWEANGISSSSLMVSPFPCSPARTIPPAESGTTAPT